MKKNYKSDFDIILRLRTCVGSGDEIRELGWPDYDWTARFYTSNKANAYTASCIGGVCTNCFEDKGHIHVVFDSHRLGAGLLQVEFLAELPNRIYPDGTQTEVSSQPLGIELVSGPGDCGTTAEVEALLPYIKGDKGDKLTYADLTEADKADLAPIISEPTDKVLEDIEPNIVRDALRKTPQELTEGEKAQVMENLGNPDMWTFIDMWNIGCIANGKEYGKYDPANTLDRDKPFRLYKLWLSLTEAIEIYTISQTNIIYNPVGVFANNSITPLAFLPCKIVNNLRDIHSIFIGQRKMKACCITIPGYDGFVGTNWNNAFRDCTNLEAIYGEVQFRDNYAKAVDTFFSCRALKDVQIRLAGSGISVSLAQSPLISFESIQHMATVAQIASADKPNTITLHPDAYARVTDELFALAAEKNITIATT